MEDYRRLLLNNKAWVEDRLNVRSDIFTASASAQTPEYLWIGCSDSRVPAEEITGTQPGELFVHRNVANLVVHTDFNILSVLQYAVDVLQVKHIIVCGHYGCGGVRAAMSRKDLGLINKWLRHIKDVYRFHAHELDAIADEEQRYNRLVELNVIEQVHHISDISFVQHAWRRHQRPMIHGWIYDLHSGHLKDLIKIDPGEHAHDIYEYDFFTPA
jgi:carbonic anhydrase